MESSKPIWASKTFWANVVPVAASLAATFGLNLDAETQTAVIALGAWGAGNIALRFATKEPVTLTRADRAARRAARKL